MNKLVVGLLIVCLLSVNGYVAKMKSTKAAGDSRHYSNKWFSDSGISTDYADF